MRERAPVSVAVFRPFLIRPEAKAFTRAALLWTMTHAGWDTSFDSGLLCPVQLLGVVLGLPTSPSGLSTLLSFITTCKRNAVEPFGWFCDVLSPFRLVRRCRIHGKRCREWRTDHSNELIRTAALPGVDEALWVSIPARTGEKLATLPSGGCCGSVPS